MRSRLRLLLLAVLASAPALCAQTTLIRVTSATEAALDAAIRAANARVFEASATRPVVIEFDAALIGRTIALTRALPALAVDHVTMRVAGAGPGDRVVLDGQNAPVVLRLSGRNVLLQNLRCQYAGTGVEQDVVIASGTQNVTFSNCDFLGSTGNTLWLVGCTNTTVQDCRFNGGGNCLAATSGSRDLDVARCTFADAHKGILLAVGHGVRIRDSLFERNDEGVVILPVCVDVTIGPNNTIRQSSQGGVVAAGTVLLDIVSNQFLGNGGSAIHLSNLCADVAIADNTVTGNGMQVSAWQVAIQDCQDVQVLGLRCADGDTGLFCGGCRRLFIGSSPAAATAVTGNRGSGITLNGCSEAALDQVVVSGNLTARSGNHLALHSCRGVDVTRASITGAPGSGRIGVVVSDSSTVRLGAGTVVHDHGHQGILVTDSTDVLLGTWTPGTGAIDVRGAMPLFVIGGARVRILGTAAAPCVLRSVASGTAAGITVRNSPDGSCGPDVVVEGQGQAATGMHLLDSAGWQLVGTLFRGHTARGLVAHGANQLRMRTCTVDGGPSASAEGILLNPGCHGAQLFGNVVQRHRGTAFAVVESSDVLLGPGNRALDNAGDGFAVQDSGSGAPTRSVTIQSCLAVGRNGNQNGFRLVRMRATLTNVTATRHGTGIALFSRSSATLVNAVVWGNSVDRNRDAGSAGIWHHSLLGTSAGGSWTDHDMIVGQDPRFVAAATGDVRLQPGSPAIDSGLHATPLGVVLPCGDADSQWRIRGGSVDRGACEYMPPGVSGNSLDLAGPWLRTPAESQLDFHVQRGPGSAGQAFLLLMSGSGTGPLTLAPGGGQAPLAFDFFTSLLLAVPEWCLGTLDQNGNGSRSLPLPPAITPFLPELTFCAVFSSGGAATNPVVVRFLP